MAWTATVEPNEYGYYPCPDCLGEHVSPLSAAVCCEPTYDEIDLED